jgi:hypothetical protein
MTAPAPLDSLFNRTTSADAVTDSAKPFRGRRLSWREFHALRPDLRPANDNRSQPIGKSIEPDTEDRLEQPDGGNIDSEAQPMTAAYRRLLGSLSAGDLWA